MSHRSSSGKDLRRSSTDDESREHKKQQSYKEAEESSYPTKAEDFERVSEYKMRRNAKRPPSKVTRHFSPSLISTVWDPEYDLLEGESFEEMLRERKKQEHSGRPGLHIWSLEEKEAEESRRKDAAQREISAPYKLCFRLQLDGHGKAKCPMLYLRLDSKKEMLTPACMFRDPDANPTLLNGKTIVCSWSHNKRYWTYHYETDLPPNSITKYNEIRYEIVCLEESEPVAD